MKKAHRITIDGTDLYYEIHGKGKPMLILHGWGVEHHIWSNPLERILGKRKNQWRRIYIDLPGMGRSVAGPDIRNSDGMVDVIEKFIAAVIPDEDFALAGQSYGGHLARGILLRCGDRVSGLLLMCPAMIPGYRKGTVPPHEVHARDDAFLRSLADDERKAFCELSIVQTKSMWKRWKKDIRTAIMPENEGFLAHRLDGAFSRDLNVDPYIFERPSLILLGRQDTEVGFEDQLDLFRRFPRATIAVLDSCGHNLQIEQRKLFGAAIREWLDRVEIYRRN